MKIVVTVPFNETENLKTFLEGVAYLKRLGHNVYETFDSSKKSSSIDLAKKFDRTDKFIKDADILIAEISNADSKVGYEIARALDEKKVVITLESEDSKNVHPNIHGNKSRTLINKKYKSGDLIETIEKSLKEAAGKLDSKFILIISPEIDRYLEWSAQTKRMHKAQIVRNAVEQQMKKDKEYKTYLQG